MGLSGSLISHKQSEAVIRVYWSLQAVSCRKHPESKMDRMDRQLQEIVENYPNFLNSDYVADCTLEDEDNIKAPFIRILPKFFSIEKVSYARKRTGCYYVVKYNFDNGGNLPTGNGLKALVKQIKRYSPANTVIVEDYIEPPKSIVVTYVVCCCCSRLDFEWPIRTSTKVWAMENSLEKFHI